MNDKTPENSKKVLISLSIIISLLFSISIAEWVLRSQRQAFEHTIKTSERMQAGMILYDAQLGWKLKPSWSGKHHHYDYDVSYNINRKGFRKSAYSSKGVEFSIFGDSFSFGLGVNDNQTFAELLNKRQQKNQRQKNYYLNYSVPGYSTDQQLLLFNQLKDEVANNVLLVVYLGNDLFDNMRDYPLQAEHGKPYFRLNNHKLDLENVPVPLTAKPAAARRDSITSIVVGNTDLSDGFSGWLARLEIFRRLDLFQKTPVLLDSDMKFRFASSLELFKALVSELEALLDNKNGRLTVVLLPGHSYVEQPTSLSAQYQEFFRLNIMSMFEQSPIKVLDLASYLRNMNVKGKNNLYFPNEGHLTSVGHQLVADYLAIELDELSLQ